MFTMPAICSPFLILTKIKRYRLRFKKIIGRWMCCEKGGNAVHPLNSANVQQQAEANL